MGGTCNSSTDHYDNLAVVHQFPHSSLLTAKLLSAEHEPADFRTAVLIISGVINVILFSIIGAPLLQERDSAFILSDSKCPSYKAFAVRLTPRSFSPYSSSFTNFSQKRLVASFLGHVLPHRSWTSLNGNICVSHPRLCHQRPDVVLNKMCLLFFC